MKNQGPKSQHTMPTTPPIKIDERKKETLHCITLYYPSTPPKKGKTRTINPRKTDQTTKEPIPSRPFAPSKTDKERNNTLHHPSAQPYQTKKKARKEKETINIRLKNIIMGIFSLLAARSLSPSRRLYGTTKDTCDM